MSDCRTKEETDKLVKRLNRIEGQVKGIKNMIVEDREGCRYIVLENRIVGKKSWNDLHEYKDDLIEKNGFEELDIVKI